MKTKSQLPALLLLSCFILPPSSLRAQGSLTPPGPPAPTMKSLDQLEPRTPISCAPFTITSPGSYYLTTNISVSSGDAITIATNGVTLDLNGFTISSTETNPTGSGIVLNSSLRDITIANGHIRGGVTNNGSGVYSGSGFASGIYFSGFQLVNVLVSRVSVSGCLNGGIYLNSGYSAVVESCTVRTVGSYGIVASTIKQSSALDCGSYAISGDQISDCRGESSGSGAGIYAYSSAMNCYGGSASGIGVFAPAAQNCYGFSAGYGYGVSAYTAVNCYGYSGSGEGVHAYNAQSCYGYCNSGNGYGVSAYSTLNCYGRIGSGSGDGVGASAAQNCFGVSSGGGNGLTADTAQNCEGYSNTGNGVGANTALNCFGNSARGIGVYATHIAIGCSGYSSSGTGLLAYVANSCHGETSTGTAESIAYKYNMP